MENEIEFGFHVIDESGEICDGERANLECLWPDCTCYDEEINDDKLLELPEMIENARIEDGFHTDD